MGSGLEDVEDVDHVGSLCWITRAPSTGDGREVLDDDGKERLWVCLVGLDVRGKRGLAYLWNYGGGRELKVHDAAQGWL